MKRLARHRSRARIACMTVVLTATFGTLVACADSTIVGSEETPEGGAVVPPLPDGGGSESEAAAEVPDAAPDVDATVPLCSTDGFCHTVLPTGLNLIGVWGDGTGVVWALSSDGDILRWGGSAWMIHHQTGAQGHSIWGSGPTDVWVASGGSILHGRGASSASLVFSTVADLPGDPNVPITSIWGTGPDDIWAVGMLEDWEQWPPFLGRALHFGGAGTGWTSDDELASMGLGFRAVWGSPTSGVWIDGLGIDDMGTFIRLVRRPKGASEWEVTSVPGILDYAIGLHGAALTSDSSVLLSGVTGVPEESINTTWRGTSIDNGATFTWTCANQPRWMREAFAYWGTGANDAWGVGENGLVSHWNGTTWTQAVLRVTDAPVGKTFRAIWGTSNDDLWVVGDGIALHKTTAGKP
ncbi:MAG: hypothetical protein BGO98_12110 [Myxococcales bacterium 68-20]|nr:MAG: hypothetical protein BGO98_12110 [Myxococcales bacterium 68-20]